MFERRMAHQSRRASRRVATAPRQQQALDAAGLILQLDMAAIIRQAGDSLRQHPDEIDRHEQRPWWRRLLGKKRPGR